MGVRGALRHAHRPEEGSQVDRRRRSSIQREEIEKDAEEIRGQEEDGQGGPSSRRAISNRSDSGRHLLAPGTSRPRRWIYPGRQRVGVLHQKVEGQKRQMTVMADLGWDA